ncbi:MAG: hypothetical protein KA369_07200 [Spirochaetes bacterium]|nr:hypothetical protein [Spirochaetota bacterium]
MGRHEAPQRTVALVVGVTNCGGEERSFITGLLVKEIGSLPGIVIIPVDRASAGGGLKPGAKPGHAAICAGECGGMLSADIVLTGSVDKNTRDHGRSIDGAAFPYLREVVREDRYHCKFSIYGASRKKIVYNLVEKTGRQGLYAIARRLSSALKAYLDSAPATPLRHDVEITLFGAAIFPVGKLSNILKAGCGTGFDAGISRVFLDGDVLMIRGRYFFHSFKTPGTAFYSSFDVMLLWGITFPAGKYLRIGPMVGAGCQVSFARFAGITRGCRKRYLHPEIGARIVGNIVLPGDFAIILAPEFVIFFERSDIALYAGAQAGVRYRF